MTHTAKSAPRHRDFVGAPGRAAEVQPAMQPERFQELAHTIEQELAKLIVGQRELVRSVLIALVAGGHVLLEGQPGLGKCGTHLRDVHLGGIAQTQLGSIVAQRTEDGNPLIQAPGKKRGGGRILSRTKFG